jgi:hypothetical protein
VGCLSCRRGPLSHAVLVGGAPLSSLAACLTPFVSFHDSVLQVEMATLKTRSRKQWKDLKKKIRTTWGTGRKAAARAQKRAAMA